MANPTTPKTPAGLPVGGRRLPLIHPSTPLRTALGAAPEIFEQLGAGWPLRSPAEADPATIAALHQSVDDHATLPPIVRTSAEVTGVFRDAVGLGWSIGVIALGGPVTHYSGGDDGSWEDCAHAVLARAATYAAAALLESITPHNFFGWTQPAREDPHSVSLIAAASDLTDADAAALIGGAIMAGFAIACAEFEIFSPTVDRGTIAMLQSGGPPHHHRFDYRNITTVIRNPTAQPAMYQCLQPGCRLLRSAPEGPPHAHQFDTSGTPNLRVEGEDLWKCTARGCMTFGNAAG